MTFDETIETFRRGEFEIDMPRIEMVAGDHRMQGPGSLSQNARGDIELKCHVAFDELQPMVDMINRSMRSEAGALVPEDNYHLATATDYTNAAWDLGRILTNHSISLPAASGTIRAVPKTLRRQKSTRSTASILALYFFEQNKRDWEGLIGEPHTIKINDTDLHLTFEDLTGEQIKVVAKCDLPFPPAFERRLIEAMQFVVGQSLNPAIVDEVVSSCRTLSLSGARPDIRRVPAYPPLATNTGLHSKQLVELLRCYLQYLADAPDEGIWSAPSSFLSLVRRSSESSIDGWLIGICVAVEGLAGLIELAPSALTAELADFQKATTVWMDDKGISAGNRQRIVGLIGQLSAIRPRDRMMSLVPGGWLIEDDIKTWTKARNSAVHTRKSSAADVERDSFQKRVDQLHRIYRLLHTIIFHVIGYTGQYTDYGERGFPDRLYP